jgi:pimeloyl-ACP methyl ester carboxylesterase
MPIAENQGAKLYWDEQGEGEPLLLIIGLGSGARLWERIRPQLAEHFRTIAFDHRGIGRSTGGAENYSIPLMASDAAAVLDAAEVESAHILGTSMGGMVAQEFALNYPFLVNTLILGCTMPGGTNAIRYPRPSLDGLTPQQIEEAMIAAHYHPATSRALIQEDRVLSGTPDMEIYQAQVAAIQNWECFERLPEITAPTLIVHGEDDRRIPFANAELIASQLENAKVVPLSNAGHVLLTDQPEAFARAVLEFLAKSPD